MEKEIISQEHLFAAIVRIDVTVNPDSFQHLIKKLHQSAFQHFIQDELLHETFKVKQNPNKPVKKPNIQKQHTSKKIQPLESKSFDVVESDPFGIEGSTRYLKPSNLLPHGVNLKNLLAKERKEIVKNIKIENASAQEQEKLKILKFNMIKTSSKFYNKMDCKDIEIQLEDESYLKEEARKPQTDLHSEFLKSNTKNQVEFPDEEIKNNKKNKKDKKSEKNEFYDEEELKKWFNEEEEQEMPAQVRSSRLGISKLSFLDDEPEKNQLNQKQQPYTASELRQHYEISKRLCIFSEKYNEEEVENIDPIDNAGFVETYFNLPDFSKQDRIELETEKNKFLSRLRKSIDVIKVFIKYGYGLKIYRQATGKQIIEKNRYTSSISFGIRLAFRQLQNFIIKDCGKNVPVLTSAEAYLLNVTLYRVREMYTERSNRTFFEILKAVFKLENIVHITKNDIFAFYNQVRKKIMERGESMENKITQTMERESDIRAKYYNYSEDGEIDFFGKENGIEGLKNIYQDDSTLAMDRLDPEHGLRNWTDEFNLEFLKLYMQYRKLGDVRRHLLKRFKGEIYETEFDLKKNGYNKFQRMIRKCIYTIQTDFHRYSMMVGEYTLTYYQKKLLTLNYSEIHAISLCEEGMDLRLMIIDYFLNNTYGKNSMDKTSQNLVKYRYTYINYIIESMAEVLEHKKKLAHVLKEPEEDKFLTYDIRNITLTKKNPVNHKDVVQLQEDDLEIQTKVTNFLEQVRSFWASKQFKSVTDLGRLRTRCKILKDQPNYKIQSGEHQNPSDSSNNSRKSGSQNQEVSPDDEVKEEQIPAMGSSQRKKETKLKKKSSKGKTSDFSESPVKQEETSPINDHSSEELRRSKRGRKIRKTEEKGQKQ